MFMSRKPIVSALATTLALGGGMAIPLASQAQLTLEEVVVTARKREESLQETPVAVSAFSGKAWKNWVWQIFPTSPGLFPTSTCTVVMVLRAPATFSYAASASGTPG